MKVTRVIVHKNVAKLGRPLCVCSVVFDDCLMLNHIRLFQGESGYYLCFPSKQDVFKEIQDLNTNTDIVYKDLSLVESASENHKKYDEFYHPLERNFYYDLLSIVVNAYSVWKLTGKDSIRPCLEETKDCRHVIENAGAEVSWR